MLLNPHDPFIQTVDAAKTISSTRDIADSTISLSDSSVRQPRLLAGTHVNPFFVPRQNPQAAALNSVQALYLISQLRMAAANGINERIIVSAPMKTGSTFISQAIYIAFAMQPVNLMLLTMRPFDYALYGAATRQHEIDELALLHSCLDPYGFVAHHHMACSPLLMGQAELYRLKFILMKRNIFDSLVSLDDFCRKGLASVDTEEGYRRRQLPPGWAKLGDEERMHHLLDRFLSFYVTYYTSWAIWEQQFRPAPLWVSYENELLGDKARLAAKICDWMGRSRSDVDILLNEFRRERDGAQFHFNRGVSGRGAVIQGANRKRVVEAFDAYSDLADWSELLG
jgi:hypothetical protein